MPMYKVIAEVTKRYEWDVEAESFDSACATVLKSPVSAEAEMKGDIARIIFAEEAGAETAAPKKADPKKPRRKRRTKKEMEAAKANEGPTQE